MNYNKAYLTTLIKNIE